MVCLDEDRVDSSRRGNSLELLDHRRRNAHPSIRLVHGQVIDVQLSARLLELGQNIAGEPSNQHASSEGANGYESIAREKVGEIGVVGLISAVRWEILEGFAK